QVPAFFRNLDRARSNFDRPHVFAGSLQVKTPGPAWLRGFTISPILIARSGLPDTISQSNLWPGANQQRPFVVGTDGQAKAPAMTPEGLAVRYLLAPTSPNFPFRPAGPLFAGAGANRTLVLPASLGNLGRNTLRQIGEFNIDLAVSRTFPIKDRVRFELRGEAFNFLNYTNFEGPNTSLSVQVNPAGQAFFNSPSFGLITSAKAARFIQLVGRFEF
ncbi:MAG: TonB-dependent receptor, partial [bacterium]